MKPKLHHCSNRITENNLDFMIELLKQLGFELFEKSEDGKAAWLGQKDKDFVLQFVESNQKPTPTEIKHNSHIGFISGTPQEDAQNLMAWVKSQGKKAMAGAWSDKEFYFDCPEIFIDFVIEIMHTSVVD